ncbi:probable auxin efflux carrier component 3b [Hordeum vulgare subsp. vulgare]|uniref:Auxin efflux carrier component n=1 Tax=Hordeum vulgare subsp. vulgare TaxID=112509 RepID=A0A8I6XK32_HORVV|nr:probable auxin efflux carrier component 3b [Hordeum vulgare subsp. vulgare]
MCITLNRLCASRRRARRARRPPPPHHHRPLHRRRRPRRTPATASSGSCQINRFVAVFAVPLLSFKVIFGSNLYAMDLGFAAADTLQKLIVLAALAVWSRLPLPFAGLDWSVTLFSLATLPNTLLMGIPLLVGMYGRHAGDLMVQLVVLQCIIWYTLLLFLFEFRAARLLISGRFPAADVRVDPDVLSLDGSHAEAQAEVAPDGSMHVVVRWSTAFVSRRSLLNGAAAGMSSPARGSNLTGMEIYSVSSSRNHTPRGSSSFTHGDFSATTGGGGAPPTQPPQPHGVLRASSFGAADLFSLHSSRQHTPRPSASYDEHAPRGRSTTAVAPVDDPKDSMHMFDWSSGASEVSGLPVFRSGAKESSRRRAPSEVPSIYSDSSRCTPAHQSLPTPCFSPVAQHAPPLTTDLTCGSGLSEERLNELKRAVTNLGSF